LNTPKAKFILTTDGIIFEAEDLLSGETIACEYQDFPNHFGFFLPLAGISTVKQLRDSSFDIRATSRLNRLYIELLKDNPEWGSSDQRHEMNHFMARMIFCFFAEDTDIFNGSDLFTDTIEKMSARDSSNTNEVISEIFRAMNTAFAKRSSANLPRWVDKFPYVNGGLFSGSIAVPRFSKIARSYLLHIGNLDWTKINPDIFGSMIQAVADDDERGALGMHYTSVPNILKVLNPLFLNDLREKLEEAGVNTRKLLNLRNRIKRIRVFDPACGSGNFLVIAYKQMREIENTINERRGENGRKSEIPLTNFRGIELRDFSAEIARLALIIAEYQCDVLYRGQKEALQEFLPLSAENWITCGNALHLDWLSLCPPTGIGAKYLADDLFETELEQPQIDFENEGGETYICGNPPYLGAKWQSKEQKKDLELVFNGLIKGWKSLDYVTGWFMKATNYCSQVPATAALVATNSITQGQQVPILWPAIFATKTEIVFAHTSFKWANLAAHNAGVTVVIIGFSTNVKQSKRLFSEREDGEVVLRETDNINAYLVAAPNLEVMSRSKPISDLATMQFGNHPYYGSALIFPMDEARLLIEQDHAIARYIRPLYGSRELIHATPRACLWIRDDEVEAAIRIEAIVTKIEQVKSSRQNAKNDQAAQKLAHKPYRFRDQVTAKKHLLVIPRVSSENRPYLPIDLLSPESIPQDAALALYDAPLWNMALIASRLHLVWIATVCGKLKTDFRYSNTLGWNTFPVPTLTEKNKIDLNRCAEDILLARETHFPATIADLYNPTTMPENLRQAHERNDEVLERIYIGRRFKNDTERLEKLFELYTKMTDVAKKPAKQ